MFGWINQKGHPVVNVEKINSTHILVTQEQFVIDFADDDQEFDEY